MNYSNEDISNMFNKTFSEDINKLNDELIIERDITAFSMCEHHLALIYDIKITVGYIPNDRVIGLSKINRVCKMVCNRHQIQERIQQDIFEVLSNILNTENIAIIIKAKHVLYEFKTS